MGGLRKAYQSYLIPTQDEPGGSGRGPVPGPAGGTPAAVSLLRSPNHRREAFCVQWDRQSRRRRTARVAAVRPYVRLHVLISRTVLAESVGPISFSCPEG
jgi:hypothetical protein